MLYGVCKLERVKRNYQPMPLLTEEYLSLELIDNDCYGLHIDVELGRT